jgi:archaellum component FlaC
MPSQSSSSFPVNISTFPSSSLSSRVANSNPLVQSSRPSSSQVPNASSSSIQGSNSLTAALNFPSNSSQISSSVSISELDSKLFSSLNQKRVQELFDDWKQCLLRDIQSFQSSAKVTVGHESEMRNCQNIINKILDVHFKIKKEKQDDEESLDFLETELQHMESAVSSIDKNLDKVFQGSGVYTMQLDKENIYACCVKLSATVDEIEKETLRKFKEIDDRVDLDLEQGEDVETFLNHCFDNLDWIEKQASRNALRVEELKKRYNFLI